MSPFKREIQLLPLDISLFVGFFSSDLLYFIKVFFTLVTLFCHKRVSPFKREIQPPLPPPPLLPTAHLTSLSGRHIGVRPAASHTEHRDKLFLNSAISFTHFN